MFHRKIEEKFRSWFADASHKPLVMKGVRQALKLGDYNVGRDGKKLTLPMYMAFLLTNI